MNSSDSTHILIVDDNPQYTLVLRKILEGGFGYKNITSVDNINDAFSLLAREPQRFGLLFVDYNFPSGESGGQLLERLQRENLLAGKIAFLITSEPTVDNLKQALAAGAAGVVAKPFDREQLRLQLERAMRAAGDEEGF